MKLRQSIKRKDYNSLDSWLDAIYFRNKDRIDDRLLDTAESTSKQEIFKQLVKERIDEGLTPLKAVDNLEKSTIFTDVSDRMASNAMEAIKGDKAAYKEFRELTKVNGRWTAFDPTKIKYSNGEYIYDNAIIISFENSPYSINFRRI